MDSDTQNRYISFLEIRIHRIHRALEYTKKIKKEMFLFKTRFNLKFN